MVSFHVGNLVKEILVELHSSSWEMPPTLCCLGEASNPKPFNSFPAELEEAAEKALRDPSQLGRVSSLWSS